MTDDAIDALERLGRILKSGHDSIEAVAAFLPDYAKGADFVYKLADELIQKEVAYIKQDRAAKAASAEQPA